MPNGYHHPKLVVEMTRWTSTKQNKIQSTLVISNSKGLSEILRDIRISTYQICRILIRLTTFNKYICNWTLEVRDIRIENIVEKRRNCSLVAISPLFHNIFTC